MNRWPYFAITIGWILAAGAIWMLGDWNGRLHRYDGCAYTRIGVAPVYVCPVGNVEPPVRSIEPEQA